MRSVIKSGQAASLGIGLGNICQRVLTLYRGSAFDIYSREGRGTSIVIHLPEDGPVKADV
jgi:two-component system LytT family sensor kinase